MAVAAIATLLALRASSRERAALQPGYRRSMVRPDPRDGLFAEAQGMIRAVWQGRDGSAEVGGKLFGTETHAGTRGTHMNFDALTVAAAELDEKDCLFLAVDDDATQ